MSTVLVIGARPASLGAAIAKEAEGAGLQVATAGMSREEDYYLDLVTDSMESISYLLKRTAPTHIVCTAGINRPETDAMDPSLWYAEHFEANVVGPMRLLRAWSITRRMGTMQRPGHFVAISSNSSTIPRTASAAYCASKAALSQALRVKAREAVGGDTGYIVYGYEPGLVAGTPMTQDTERQFAGNALHRMRGVALSLGVNPADLAALIVAGLQVPGTALNGTLIRYDGGEL
jgi:NAD(P)-dependent dehydrogenase (short-subunit alcohol dehydrogenase family)